MRKYIIFILAFTIISTTFSFAQSKENADTTILTPIIVNNSRDVNEGDNRDLVLPVQIYYSHTTGEVYIQYEDYIDCDYYITTPSGQIVTSGTLFTPGTYKVLIPPTIIAPYLIIDNRRIYAVYEL